MKRKHKKYSRPKRSFERERIEEEASIKEQFGLKNKKEIWKAEARINSIREKAKKLISASPEKQQALFERLKKIGLEVNSIGDVLSLTKKDYLNRRLQTILVKKKLASTPKNARQLIVHKKVSINGRAINSPSYIVPKDLEDKITIIKKEKRAKAKKLEQPETQESKIAEKEA